MSALQKLWFLKIKTNIRNLYKKPASAIFTTLMVIIYGGIFGALLFMDKTAITAGMMIDVHTSILIVLGFVALMVCTTLFQKRKALFFENDAFYLFSGPFSRKQVMRYLMSQTILQAVMLGFISLFGLSFTGMNVAFTNGFYFFMVCLNSVLVFFFLVLTDYLYILSITNQKYKNISRIVVVLLGVFVAIIFAITMIQSNFDIQNGLMNFVESSLFYLVPMFGWAKLALIGFVEGKILLVLLGSGLLIVALAIVYYFFTHFKGDFYEQALEDSISFTAYYKKARAGKDVTLENRKVKNVTSSFQEGAWAIFSKGMLQMRKVNGFITLTDVGVIAFYFVLTIFMDMGFGMFVYMMVFWLFGELQRSSLNEELKNYLIYLIPDNPLKKLIAVILPTLIKVMLVVTVAMIGAGLFYQMGILVTLQYLITIYGYVFVFTAASVLAIRILKSRTNAMMENLLRMLIVIICAIPSAGLTIYLMSHPELYSTTLLNVISYSSLALNFIVSIVIILSCKNMLKGRELNSD